MLQKIKTFLFGQRAQGEPLQSPKIKTYFPTQKIDEDQWNQEMKFGSRYGTRGSFYQPHF
jgi:hypothetical protein